MNSVKNVVTRSRLLRVERHQYGLVVHAYGDILIEAIGRAQCMDAERHCDSLRLVDRVARFAT